MGILPNDEQILNISRLELIEEGLLGKDFDFQIISSPGCGESFEGVAVAAQMYHVDQVRAFIGPYCNAELDAVAKMGSFWNIPVISYMATTTAVTDRTIYKTLARISSKNTNSIAKAVVKLLEHYGWKRIAVVTNTGAVAYERVQSFEDEFRKSGISVATKIMFDEGWNSTDIIRSGLLNDIENNARIVIGIFSATREMTKELMQAVFTQKINNPEYAFILPWLQAGPKDTSPWIGVSGETLQQVKDIYANAIIIDDVNGFDNTLVDNFIKRVEKYGITKESIDAASIFSYIHLYDSLKLYALAAVNAYQKSGNNISIITNGRAVWNNMRRLTFEGTAGVVVMDDLADRAPQFAAFFISADRENVMKMVNMDSVPIPNCNSSIEKSGCFDLKLTDIITGFWPSSNGNMPPDEPVCGFKGQKCSYMVEIAIGSTILGFIILVISTCILYRYCQSRALDKMPWRVFHEDLRMIDDEQARSLISLGSANTKLSNMSTGAKKHVIIGVNTHATYHRYAQKRSIKFVKSDLILLTQMKQTIHDNINPFLGIAFNEKEEMLVLWKFCSRGTVQDLIYNKNMTLDEKFHAAFVSDIVKGLEYLHLSQIGYHGSLSPWACAIDRNWSVRLTDYGISNALERWEKEGAINIEVAQSDDDKSQAAQRTSSIYYAPEFLKNREQNKRRRMDQSWVAQSKARRQAADIYAFGMVMYEILFRSLPFPDGTDIAAVAQTILETGRPIRPQIQDSSKVHPDIYALLTDCWSENPEIRPSIRRVRLNTEMALKTKGSLVDQMMRVMETYANNLEKLVKERTSMLEEANLKAERLLNQLLPKYVANELKLGRPVAPRLFSSATVLFSDIVGFTKICSTSTPLEVVNMLNGIYTGFDERIQKHGAYKVETIGDAYMVVSGIPEENGTNHVKCIANISLEMRSFLLDYEVPHRKRERIKCRWGFHTGPVAAGVVGLTAPRYCLFGDTVNTSSRMESTGLPEMIQISQAAYDLIQTKHPFFKCTKRGEVDIKGKGMCTTYWLDGKENLEDSNQQQLKNFDKMF
uniref:Guanylate cyclase n=1 Tax=Panagrolaimus sp. PS1159 TaxID=55785 RepID=A0AC35GUX1_9BILA